LLASLSQVATDLDTTPTIVNLTVALYMLSMAVAPLWWSSLSELFGRRSIYLVSLALFVVFAILCALSKTVVMLIVMRMLCGVAAASVQAVGAGTISDIWKPIERGKAMGIFYLGPLCGPLFAPVIGGALASKWRWRATMWFIAIYGGMLC
jgi:multidrug resistance protein